MRGLQQALPVFALLFAAVTAHADAPSKRAVVLTLCVAGQHPDRIEAALTTPVERLLYGLPGVEGVYSMTSEGNARFTVHFRGEASEDDAASVALALERSEAGSEFPTLSRSVQLGQVGPEGFAPGLPACGAALR